MTPASTPSSQSDQPRQSFVHVFVCIERLPSSVWNSRFPSRQFRPKHLPSTHKPHPTPSQPSPTQNHATPPTQMAPPKYANLFPRSSAFYTKPALPYTYHILKQLSRTSPPVRATPETFTDPGVAHAALLEYARMQHPFHRFVDPPAGMGSGGRGKVLEGYIQAMRYKDGDWIEEVVTGWVWVERVWEGEG
ncbi:hypothetical protein P171DRAFT_428940 [Karstenula rhodostoma CBS 690.94]|uniref:Uncharacterized protein n=1 Tax=Karstenula rhodostoma CBS 690.94 TaxID=1392251 RepID=A0A9P4PTF8_9PLEO|nr:hypothetical protein P171DRAFT_428940 [Karstenula rhodostoma CBS 690.94]